MPERFAYIIYNPSGNGAATGITDKGDGSGVVKQQTEDHLKSASVLKDDKLPKSKDDVLPIPRSNIYLPRLNNGGNLYFGDQKNGTVPYQPTSNQGCGRFVF